MLAIEAEHPGLCKRIVENQHLVDKILCAHSCNCRDLCQARRLIVRARSVCNTIDFLAGGGDQLSAEEINKLLLEQEEVPF